MGIVALDFFCGAGGVTCGLRKSGIEVIAGFDIDASVKETYESNNPRSKFIEADISKLAADAKEQDGESRNSGSKEVIEDLLSDARATGSKILFAGCAPCQPFSKKNKQRGNFSDPRRTLLRDYADLVKAHLPDLVFMENVEGIARLEGDVLSYFQKILADNGYEYDCGILDMKDYGVPQKRKRFVLMASRISKIRLPEATHGEDKRPYNTVRDAIGHLPPIKAGESHESVPNHVSAVLSPLNLERIRKTPHDGGRRTSWPKELWLKCHLDKDGNPQKGHTDSYGRLHWEAPAPTLTTRFNSYSTGAYGHPTQDRALSLKEGALLQGFPEDYVFHGSPQAITRQIGNAVPPLFSRKIGETFLESLGGDL